MKRRIHLAAICVAALALPPLQATAQAPAAWPQKPIKVTVAFPPGTPGDMLVRGMGGPLGNALGQAVVVENKPGAGGNVGTQAVLNTQADGYNVLTGPDTILTVNPQIYTKLSFAPENVVPVTTLGSINLMLACHPSVGVKTVAELTALAKTKQLNYASGGAGVPGHLAIEMYLAQAGIHMTHVPYRGPAPATADLLAGQVGCAFLVTNQIVPHVKSGKLVGLAVSTRKRSPLAPDVPTMHEAGVTGFEASFAEMLYVPKGTPQAVIDRLQTEVAAAMKRPEVLDVFRSVDVEPMGHSPAVAAQRIQTESARWAPVIKRIGLKVD
ncbi:tripartite tricarboxylate transporter substrate binding protein [Ramlibacter sp. 2FC]|uniref:Bug family tripartite tricarboxylate transporter substrate binding protein n=1 Tax=Ramlibacter sp. 2FC TaxID=2502188 RepID=UPI0010F9BB39|nr:tripartite tricarboxylate transporter substrate binding protein [Ramlibacter sp. 2FC]